MKNKIFTSLFLLLLNTNCWAIACNVGIYNSTPGYTFALWMAAFWWWMLYEYIKKTEIFLKSEQQKIKPNNTRPPKHNMVVRVVVGCCIYFLFDFSFSAYWRPLREPLYPVFIPIVLYLICLSYTSLFKTKKSPSTFDKTIMAVCNPKQYTKQAPTISILIGLIAVFYSLATLDIAQATIAANSDEQNRRITMSGDCGQGFHSDFYDHRILIIGNFDPYTLSTIK